MGWEGLVKVYYATAFQARGPDAMYIIEQKLLFTLTIEPR